MMLKLIDLVKIQCSVRLLKGSKNVLMLVRSDLDLRVQ